MSALVSSTAPPPAWQKDVFKTFASFDGRTAALGKGYSGSSRFFSIDQISEAFRHIKQVGSGGGESEGGGDTHTHKRGSCSGRAGVHVVAETSGRESGVAGGRLWRVPWVGALGHVQNVLTSKETWPGLRPGVDDAIAAAALGQVDSPMLQRSGAVAGTQLSAEA